MIDHVSVRIQDFPRLLSFYRAALAPLGYQVIMEYPDAVGMGEKGKPDLWLMKTDKPLNPTHVAISSTRDRIDAFHAVAIAAGATDNGPPGPRDYHPHYYAAFVLDPEGNNIEVVSHARPQAAPQAKATAKATAKKTAPKKTAARRAVKPKAKAKPAKKAQKSKKRR
jgi:catechol 2,3-dioxygenase-like lactoylglutathione lyase family enzyme